MPRFRNDTGSVLHSQEFGVIGPGEFEAIGYDPEIHGVIPGCTWLDAPHPEDPPDGLPGGDTPPDDGTPEDTSTPGDEGDQDTEDPA